MTLSSTAVDLDPAAQIFVGVGWDVRTTTGSDFDLDASALVLNAGARVLSDAHFVFYNNLSTPDGSVVHFGDNLSGEGGGDDEVFVVTLDRLPHEVHSIVFCLSIYDAEARGQSFSQVQNLYIRLFSEDGAEIAVAHLDQRGDESSMILASLERHGAAWRFSPQAKAESSLIEIVRRFGVNLD